MGLSKYISLALLPRSVISWNEPCGPHGTADKHVIPFYWDVAQMLIHWKLL